MTPTAATDFSVEVQSMWGMKPNVRAKLPAEAGTVSPD
jgi:hypothetical protein